MIGRFFESIASFLIKNKLLFWSSFVIIVSILLFGISKLRIEKDIYSIFPKGKEFQQFSKVIQENNLNKQLVFSFAAFDDEDKNIDYLETISKDLEQQFNKEIGNLQIYRLVDQLEMVDYLQSASIAFLNNQDYQNIGVHLNNDSIYRKLEVVKDKLSGTNAVFIGSYFAKDPLNVLGNKMSQFNIQSDSSAYTVENGIVYSQDKKSVFFFADLLIDSKDNAQLEQFDNKLHNFIHRQNAKNKLDVFGVYQIALANAKQIQKDTTVTSIVGAALILLLLIGYYRSLVVPIFFLLPAGFGVLTGLGVTGFINPNINAISLATASVLLGIVLDYSFHFYTHYKHSGNLLNTIREIGTPLTIGSFTTIAAFVALLFTESIVLKNFGLIALFTLLGAALFTLTALPVFIKTFSIKLKYNEHKKEPKPISKLAFRLMLLGVVAITTFSLLKTQGFNFDGDLNNLAYHPQELKEKENAFTGVNPKYEKRLYLFSNGKTLEEAQQTAQQLYVALENNKKQYEISEIISPSPFLIPENDWQAKQNLWIEFWKQHPSTQSEIQLNADKLGFSTTAFTPFFHSLSEKKNISNQGKELIEQMGMTKLIHTNDSTNSILTSITVSKNTVENLKTEIRAIDNVYIMDISEVASSMLSSVKNDFNFLLYFSSILVFVSLLVVYGRIELTLFAFFPLFLSWIWILGITNYFDIKFNFVNIILTTFIFGLGDDYSIFITDGLIQKYKTKKDSIASFKSAVVLSGLSTIIGTGVLIFAKHPSINSIAIISTLGISTIMLITLFVQPGIFNWFVTRRTEKKRGPITFFTVIYSILLYTYFFLGSMFLSILLLFFVLPFPAKKVKKQRFMNYLISKLAKSTLYAGVHVKKKILNPEKLDYSTPSIVIANHTSFLDILTVLMLSPKTIIMVKSWVYNSPIFGIFIRYAGYIFVEKGTETNIEMVKKQMENGYSLAIFPEGTRSVDGELHRFHKGAFVLSKALNTPIQPLLIVGLHEINPKNDIMINPGELYVQPLDKIYPIKGESDKDYTKRAQQIMREGLTDTRLNYAKTNYWYDYLMRSYVLKGPVLEWYVRVKFKLERKNFDYYDELIGSRKTIYDVGCGYGYLSYYLHYRNNERIIIGIDYDEEKALTANNGLKRNDNIQFEYADIKSYDFKPCDVIFLNDVLHYLPKDEQFNVLENCINKLNKNGILFIRDGVVDLDGRIKNTERTEQLSTKFFKFNKAENDLEFLEIAAIKNFANTHGLEFEMIEHSKTTSNVLFVLRKNEN
ncbi:MAG: MMPL family transporter [Crocinitomicaceae bacterium]|nr:MMPL family transporter [Crocinitomicaceae bacterium]